MSKRLTRFVSIVLILSASCSHSMQDIAKRMAQKKAQQLIAAKAKKHTHPLLLSGAFPFDPNGLIEVIFNTAKAVIGSTIPHNNRSSPLFIEQDMENARSCAVGGVPEDVRFKEGLASRIKYIEETTDTVQDYNRKVIECKNKRIISEIEEIEETCDGAQEYGLFGSLFFNRFPSTSQRYDSKVLIPTLVSRTGFSIETAREMVKNYRDGKEPIDPVNPLDRMMEEYRLKELGSFYEGGTGRSLRGGSWTAPLDEPEEYILLHKASKKRSKGKTKTSQTPSKSTPSSTSTPGGPRGPKKDDDDDKKKHPNGKYEDGTYHGKNKSGKKSAGPPRGREQECLDKGEKVFDKDGKFTGKVIAHDDDKIVVFMEHRPGNLHGHVRTIKEINSGNADIKRTAIEQGWMTGKGKSLLTIGALLKPSSETNAQSNPIQKIEQNEQFLNNVNAMSEMTTPTPTSSSSSPSFSQSSSQSSQSSSQQGTQIPVNASTSYSSAAAMGYQNPYDFNTDPHGWMQHAQWQEEQISQQREEARRRQEMVYSQGDCIIS